MFPDWGWLSMCVCLGVSLSFFFFSSRRRHTRWPRDWSSDVCSSDLAVIALVLEDDLGQGDRRQVFAGGGVDHRDLLAGANHLLDLLERDVATLLRVVELSVQVPFDDVRHRTPSTGWLRGSL